MASIIRKHSLPGIISIILSLPFYYIVHLQRTTDRLDAFYSQNFLFAFPAIYLVLPGLVIGFAIAAFKQREQNRLFAYLAAIFAVPVFLYATYWSFITIVYIHGLLIS